MQNRLQRFGDLVEEGNVNDACLEIHCISSKMRKSYWSIKKKKKQVNLVSQAALENPEHCSSIPVSTANQTQKQHLPLLVKGVCSYRCHMPFAFPTVQFQLVTCNDTRAVCWVTSHHADFYQQHADFYQLLDHWKHRCYNTHLETLAA